MSSKIFATLFLTLTFFWVSPSEGSPTNDKQWVKDIADSVAKINVNQYLYKPFATACYPDIDCFDTNGPMKHIGKLPFSPEQIKTSFNTYTSASPAKLYFLDPKNKESLSLVKGGKGIVVISHGFGMSGTSAELNSIKDHLFKFSSGAVGTVVIVDWATGAASPDYNSASVNTELVGRQIGFFLSELMANDNSIKPEDIHLIGFSLGAQVSGFAGKWTQSKYGFKVGRITGLDAAAPNFESYPGSYLTADDATFVDAIHSSAGGNILFGEVGFVAPYGHIDFYPNGGKKQPHCGGGLFPSLTCNHYGSVLFFDASLHAKEKCLFKGAKCASWPDYANSLCTEHDTELGYFVSKEASGTRFLATTKKTPFCQ